MAVPQGSGTRNDFCGEKPRKRDGYAYGYGPPKPPQKVLGSVVEKEVIGRRGRSYKSKCPNFPTFGYAHLTFYFVLKLLALQLNCSD